jgi:putative ABC transport system permease protein
VLSLVLTNAMRPVGLGLALGLIASCAVTPLLKSQLVRVSAIDPLTLSVATAILVAAAVVGCMVPAWRAIRVDPVVALRHD